MTVHAIVGNDELNAALRDPRFRRGYRNWKAWQNGEVDLDSPMAVALIVDNMITSNGADHLRLRRPVARAFSPRRVEALRPQIREVTRELLDGMARQGQSGQPVDLMAAFADQLPVALIGEILGIPPGRRAPIAPLVNRVFSGTDPRANQELFSYLGELLHERRANPGDDVYSALITAHDDEEKLSDEELIGTASVLAVAGYDTTRVAIGNIVYALLTHPHFLARARAGDLPWSNIIEEGVRHRGPVWMLPVLYPTEDVVVGGYTLPAGEPVYMGYGPANRDRRVYYGADEFNPDRGLDHSGHLGFGAGAHYCLGAPLARMELEIALPMLFDRFEHLALAEPEPEWAPSAMIHSPARLPVTVVPRRAPLTVG